jgi:predicted lipoprotein
MGLDGGTNRIMRHSRRFVLGTIAVGAASLLAGCKIVAIGGDADSAGFSAERYAADIWESQALPHFTAAARPLDEVLSAVRADLAKAGANLGYRPATEGSPWTFVVTGTGAVSAKNTKSRAGTLTVTLDRTDPPAEFDIQIGPVIRGSAIRDALPFVSFKDFTNQLEFADVGKALTSLALKAISDDTAAIEPGDRISFTGAMSLNSAGDRVVVTPVSLKPAS